MGRKALRKSRAPRLTIGDEGNPKENAAFQFRTDVSVPFASISDFSIPSTKYLNFTRGT